MAISLPTLLIFSNYSENSYSDANNALNITPK